MKRPKEYAEENEASRAGYCWHCGDKPNTIPCAMARVYTSDEELRKLIQAKRLMCYDE